MTTSSGRGGKITGMVTRTDIDFLYVWTWRHPLQEVKFPRYNPLKLTDILACGDLVKIDDPADLGAVQDFGSIERCVPSDLKVIHPNDSIFEYAVRVYLSFPPENEGYCAKELETTKTYGVRAIGHSSEFGRVALLSDKIAYEPLKLYEGYVTRIPTEKDWIGRRIGTLFIISDAVPLKELRGTPNLLESVRQCMPWKELFVKPSPSPRQQSRNALELFGPTDQQLHESANASASGNNNLWAESPTMDDGNQQQHFEEGSRSPSIEIEVGTPPPLMGNTSTPRAGNAPQNGNGMGSSPAAAAAVVQPRTVDNDPTLRELADTEDTLFALLVVCKLKSVYRRSPTAGICLQRQLLDVCNQYSLSFLPPGPSGGVQQEQQQEDGQ